MQDFTEKFLSLVKIAPENTHRINFDSPGYVIVKDIEIDTFIINHSIFNVEFYDCEFKEHITNVSFTHCTFKNCKFSAIISFGKFRLCQFDNCEFSSCYITQLGLFDTTMSNTRFNNCIQLQQIDFVGCTFFNLNFENSELLECSFSAFLFLYPPALTFSKCRLTACQFSNSSLNLCSFSDTLFIDNSFIGCTLNEYTFRNGCQIEHGVINKIDLQTILHSSLNQESLNLFGITNSDAKEYVKELTTELKFQSVFISYSFNDNFFAKSLNEKIRQRGLSTFLWENDAPGGKRLKKIMKEYIHKHDRVLFIASENSLKSQACHFELSEARNIQDKEWKDVYFPIHIDDYLFKLEKDDIRPKENRDEYWKNIEEIKDFNSVDFSAFKSNYENNPEFDEKVSKLVKDLRV